MKQLISLSRAQMRGYFRDKGAVFFTFLFPLMFLGVFGMLMGDDSTSKTEVAVVGEGPVIEALPKEVLKVKRYDTEDAAVAAVKKGTQNGVLVEHGDELKFRYSTADQVGAAKLQSILGSTIDAANLQAAGVKDPHFKMQLETVDSKKLKPIEQLAPGIVSWAVATSACFGAAMTFVQWRKNQVLRRLRLAPVSTWKIVTSRVALALVIATIQAVVFFGLAHFLMDFRITSGFLLFIPILICGTLAFLSIGQLIGSFTKTPDAASAAGNLVVLPMAFLSGTFIPADQLPKWAQTVSNLLPLKHMNEGTLDVLVRGKGAEALLMPCGVLLGFTVVLAVIAAFTFKWEN